MDQEIKSLIDCVEYEEVDLEKGTVIATHHQKVEAFYLLIEGTINYYLSLDHPRKDVLVGKTKHKYTPIGWSGLNTPGRFMCKIKVSSKSAKLIKFRFAEVQQHIVKQHQNEVLIDVCRSLYLQLGASILKQIRYAPKYVQRGADPLDDYYISPESTQDEIVDLMRRSPFMETFGEKYLRALAGKAERRDYVDGELIFQQDQDTEGLFILIQGEVSIRRLESDQSLSLRSISTPGFVFGWSSLFNLEDFCSATTSSDTSVYFISRESLDLLTKDDEEFGTMFYLRLLWLTGNQLHVSHVRLVSLKLGHDQLAIHNIIDSNRSKLKLRSRLHEVPHLLNDRNTLHLGYELLHQLNKNGAPTERHLASLCLDLLKSSKKELDFLNGLKDIYTKVAEEGQDQSAEEVRRSCSDAVKKVFTKLSYQIDGWQNLPDHPGHIFIYNHLLNDPYYTLPNNFQITLDSHFISSMVLDEKYGDPGLRIVRIGQGAEYGHQNYYLNLGYINVYTKDSGQADAKDKDQARDIFYQEAGKQLADHRNLIISPEGISYTTEESPGPFKMGAFSLALKQNTEPLIVPIVLCYFDRRVINTNLYCRILEPFKVSERLDGDDKASIKKFTKTYQKSFAREVKRSIKIANKLSHQ